MISLAQLKRSACVLLPGREHEIERLRDEGWHLVDFDAFLENLPLWSQQEAIEALFSDPIPGIRQFLAEIKQTRVGLFGDGLTDVFQQKIAERYMALGYNVLIERSPQQFFPAQHLANPRIMFS